MKNNYEARYWALKERYPEALLLFHAGDFYLAYGEDARDLARYYRVGLAYANNGMALAGFPESKLGYILTSLVGLGHKVGCVEGVLTGFVPTNEYQVVNPNSYNVKTALL